MFMSSSSSGIPAVGDVAWGTHFCQFYHSREDLIDTLVPYFQEGIKNNEQCLWITSEPLGAVDAQDMLRAAVPDLEQHLKRGQIEILDHRDWYSRNGSASTEDVLQGWLQREEQALQGGHAGLRLTGNTFWLDRKDWRSFAEYEAMVNHSFRSRRIIGLCSYCLGRCDPEGVIDVVRNHQFALVRRSGDWDLIENSSLKIAKEELYKLNEELELRVEARTAALEAALRARDEFLSVASHELKTPVASFKLYIDGVGRALQRGSLAPDDLRRRITRAQEQCGRLDRLVQELLDISQLSSGSMPMSFEELDLTEIARGVAERFEEEARKAGSTITLTGDPSVVGKWDRMRLEQIQTNLIINAIKYAPGAAIELKVVRDGDRAVLSVRDRGPGIAPQDQERVFERFAQLSPNAHRTGFGLGLWIVRQIVAALGGTVHLESALGAGSTFTVALPRALG